MSQLVIPGAFYWAASDKTYMTYIDRSGNIEGIEYNHATGTLGGPYTIHASFEVDAHSSPAILRPSTGTFAGRFFAVYTRHGTSIFNIKVANTADSMNGWNLPTPLDSKLGGSTYTDPQLYEEDGLLQMFYRDEPVPGTDSRWCRSTCDPSLPTTGWAAQSQIYRIAGTRSYMLSCHDPANGRIHFIVTNGANQSFSKLGHFYLDVADNTYRKSDGTEITATRPYNFSHVTEAYSGTTAFPWNVVVDDDGFPVFAARETVGSDLRYIYARWDGAAWSSTNVASAGTGYEYGGAGSGHIAYGAAVDDSDPNNLWLIKDVSGQPELFLYTTADGGATFDDTQVTTGSTALQTQVICIRNAHTDLRVYWMRGTFTHWTNWNTGLMGAGIS